MFADGLMRASAHEVAPAADIRRGVVDVHNCTIVVGPVVVRFTVWAPISERTCRTGSVPDEIRRSGNGHSGRIPDPDVQVVSHLVAQNEVVLLFRLDVDQKRILACAISGCVRPVQQVGVAVVAVSLEWLPSGWTLCDGSCKESLWLSVHESNLFASKWSVLCKGIVEIYCASLSCAMDF